jgi:hypothetical protein
MGKHYMMTPVMKKIIENQLTLRRTSRRPSLGSGGGSYVSAYDGLI